RHQRLSALSLCEDSIPYLSGFQTCAQFCTYGGENGIAVQRFCSPSVATSSKADASQERSSFMPSAVWSGHLHFGLVVMPVRLLVAARTKMTRFRRLYRKPANDSLSVTSSPPFRSES